MARELVVVIATSGGTPLLGRTLESLVECERPEIYREAVVVENGPRADAEAVCERFSRSLGARYLHVPEPNKCRALNRAIEEVGDRLIFFCDDDVFVEPATLMAYARAAAPVERGAFFGGPVLTDYENPPPGWLLPYLPWSARGWSLAEATVITPSKPPRFLGFNWAAFARDLREVGGFDERLGPGRDTLVRVGDESEMQKRLLHQGARPVYLPDAVVRHAVPAERCSADWAARRAYHTGAWRILDRGLNGDACIFGYPAWVLRRLAGSSIRRGLAAVAGNTEQRFAARYRHTYDRGLLMGVSLHKRWIAR